jgi:threonine dehydratase
MTFMPSLHDVYRAQQRIKSMIRQTPLVASSDLAGQIGAKQIHLKLECLQNTGSFKVRGAANKILSLTDGEKKKGVITFSTGNHGKAVAWVSGRAGIKAIVCLSEHVPVYRSEMIKALGAEVSQKGRSQDEAEKNYQEIMVARDLIPVVPFDDPLIIAGQGTIALEILSELPDTDILMIPLSGGGLLSGMAMAAKCVNPGIHVVGLSLERSPAMLESLKAGRPVPVGERDTLADSLLGGIGFDNQYTLAMVDKFADEHLLVSEEEIKDGMFYIFEKHRLIVEGAAAVGMGALLNHKIDVKGKKAVALLSGSTVNSADYIRIIQSRLSSISDHQQSQGDEEGPWKGPGSCSTGDR